MGGGIQQSRRRFSSGELLASLVLGLHRLKSVFFFLGDDIVSSRPGDVLFLSGHVLFVQYVNTKYTANLPPWVQRSLVVRWRTVRSDKRLDFAL